MTQISLSKLAVLCGAIVLTGLVAFSGCTKNAGNENAQTASTSSSSNTMNTSTTPSATEGLKIEDLKVGTGAEATPGKMVTVHYTGWLTNGTKFDSSVDRGKPFKFHLGGGQVIQGWDKGVAGMKVGGKRKLTIPPELGYGARGVGPIPPNSTLVFEVELLGVE